MATGTAGGTGRQYHTQQVHYCRKTVTFADAGTSVLVGTLPAGALLLRAYPWVTVAFTGTGTDLLDIGVTGELDKFATDLDVSSVGQKTDTDLAGEAGALMAADTPVYATYADANSDADAGSAIVVLEFLADNDG